MFLGAREFGHKEQRLKTCLILDTERYRYQAFCSDIAGQDIRAHSGDPAAAILSVRNFLANQLTSVLLPGGSKMVERYELFRGEVRSIARRFHLSESDLSFMELRNFVHAFLAANPW